MKTYIGIRKKSNKYRNGNLNLLFIEQNDGRYLCTTTVFQEHPSIGKFFTEEEIQHDLIKNHLKILKVK